jgi:hypothetical protein
MSRAAALRLGAFAGALALAFAAAFGIGSAIDPIAAADDTSGAPAHGEEMGGMEQTAGHGSGHDSSGQLPGLAVSDAGYTFAPVQTAFTSGTKTELRFVIQGPNGKPVTQYTETHEKNLHLIVVRRDLSGFHHLHPVMAPDGTWSIPFTFTAGGTWRLYADFQPAGHDSTLTLGTDVNVTGMYVPVPVAEPASVYSFHGYDVTLQGNPVAGKESELTFTVSRDGKPVTDLQPYLGAFGHLVSLRGGDLAYLHNHPAEHAEPGSTGGPSITFGTTFPTAATYSLFLDFQHAGAVHTAEFTVKVGADGTTITPPSPTPAAVPTKTVIKPTGKPSTPAHAETPHGH